MSACSSKNPRLQATCAGRYIDSLRSERRASLAILPPPFLEGVGRPNGVITIARLPACLPDFRGAYLLVCPSAFAGAFQPAGFVCAPRSSCCRGGAHSVCTVSGSVTNGPYEVQVGVSLARRLPICFTDRRFRRRRLCPFRLKSCVCQLYSRSDCYGWGFGVWMSSGP